MNTAHHHASNVQAVVSQILGRGGCARCGLIAFLPAEFQGDPSPEVTEQRVASHTEFSLNS